MIALNQVPKVIRAFVLCAAVAACGANAGATPTGAPASPTAAAPATLPPGLPTALSDPACGEVPAAVSGRWQKTIKPEDLPPELFDADTGVFVLKLGPGHHARTDVDLDHPGDDEDLCWTAETAVYVTDREDCIGDSIGAYEWAIRNDELDFTTIHDDCFWRPFQTVFKTWTRSPS